MEDGYRSEGVRQWPDPSTTFAVKVFDEGDPDVTDDETWTYYVFSIPDDGKRELPVTFEQLSGAIYRGNVWPGEETTPFSGGRFTVESAIPGGFIASYDLGNGSERIAGRGIIHPEGKRRTDAWPYDPREPTPTHWQRFVQLVEDAWNGAI